MKNKVFLLILIFSTYQTQAMLLPVFLLKKVLGTKEPNNFNQLFTDKNKTELLCKSLKNLSFKNTDDIEILKNLLLLNKTTNQCAKKFIIATKFYDQFSPDSYLTWQKLDNVSEELILCYPIHKANKILFNLCNGILPTDPCDKLKQPLSILKLFGTKINYPKISDDLSTYIKTCDIKKGDANNPFLNHLVVEFHDTMFKKRKKNEQRLFAEDIKNLCTDYTSILFRFSLPDPITELNEENWQERLNKNRSNNAHALKQLFYILTTLKSNHTKPYITIHFVHPKHENYKVYDEYAFKKFFNDCIDNSLLDTCRLLFDEPIESMFFGKFVYLFLDNTKSLYKGYMEFNLSRDSKHKKISVSKFLGQFPQLSFLADNFKEGEKEFSSDMMRNFIAFVISRLFE